MRKQIIFFRDSSESDIVQKAAYTYLALPVMIFFAFWLKPVYGIAAEALIFTALIRIWMRPGVWQIQKADRAVIRKLAVCFWIICIWVYFSGIGRFVFQNDDHFARNAIFTTLVNEHWPVRYEGGSMGLDRPAALIYYFAFWLPAAVVGKLSTIEAGFAAQAVWAVIGIFLAFCLMCKIRGKISVRDLLVFVFFSGLDVIGAYVLDMDTQIIADDHLEWWVGMQYSSFTTQLFWVFNQAVPAWLITALVMVQKDRRTLVFIYSFSVLSCTFPAAGLIPVLAYHLLSCGYEAKLRIQDNFIKLIKETCTFENVVCGGMTGILSFLFLRNNNSGQLRDVIRPDMTSFLLFFFFEAGIYFLIIYRYCSRNGLYYVCLLSLALIPFVRVGSSGDFCMRASIPALLVLCLLVTETLDRSFQERNYPVFAALALAVLIGSVTPAHEFIRTFRNTVSGNLNQGEAVLIGDGKMAGNFYGYTDDSFFFKYLVRDR